MPLPFKKSNVNNPILQPTFFRRKRHYFKLLWRTRFLLRKSEFELSWKDIFSSFLTVPILDNKSLEAMVSRYPKSEICVRSVRIFEGDFDDETFDWYHLASGDFSYSGVEIQTETVILKGTRKRLIGLKSLYGLGLNINSFLIVESYAFIGQFHQNTASRDFSELLSKISDGIRIRISEILAEFKIVSGNPYLKGQLIEPNPYSFQFLSFRPFTHVYNIISHHHDLNTHFKLKSSNLNTSGYFELVSKKNGQRSSRAITYLLLMAMEQRLSGNAILVPIMCHTAIENFIYLLEQELYKKDEIRPDKFKKRLNEIEKRLNLNGANLYIKNIYAQNVYEIRNTCAHEGKNISMFLADYSVWVTTSFISSLLHLEEVKKMQNFSKMAFPFEGHDKTFLQEKTKFICNTYGNNLERLAVPIDELVYDNEIDVRTK